MRSAAIAVVTPVLLLTLLGVGPAWAFDGQRTGFVLGFGTGPSYFDENPAGTEVGSWGLKLDTKIGFAPSDRIQLHYSGRNHIGRSELFWQPSVLAFYYLEPTAPSLLFAVGTGFSYRTEIESNGDRHGYAILGGIGYEFVPYVYFEFDVAKTVDTTFASDWNLSLTLGILAY